MTASAESTVCSDDGSTTLANKRGRKGRVAHKQGAKLQTMQPVSIRFPAELWRRVGWQAAADGLDRAAFVRATLHRATRGARAPECQEFRGLSIPRERLAAWQKAAEKFNVPIDEFARRVVDNFLNTRLSKSETDQ